MKTLQNTKINQTTETVSSSRDLEFGELLVYNEMADQTSVKLNLIEQIHSQLNSLDEINQKRKFLMKEILEVIS